MEKQQDVPEDNDLSNWLSTYGLITVEKILDRYGIRLTVNDLTCAVRNPDSLFFNLIQLPLKHLFNGLVFQQAKDYQVYAQKLFIDYLLSGEQGQENSQVEDDLEVTRKKLVAMGEAFHEEDLANSRLIAKSQMILMKTAQLFHQQLNVSAKKVKQAFQHTACIIHDDKLLVKSLYTLIADYDLKTRLPSQHEAWLRVQSLLGQSFDLSLCDLLRDEVDQLSRMNHDTETILHELRAQSVVMGETLKQFRTDFSKIIVTTNEMLAVVTGYHVDAAQLIVNQHDLHFDSKIGE